MSRRCCCLDLLHVQEQIWTIYCAGCSTMWIVDAESWAWEALHVSSTAPAGDWAASGAGAGEADGGGWDGASDGGALAPLAGA